MKITGKLYLRENKCDYLIFHKGRVVDVSKVLDIMLFEKVSISIKNLYNNKTLVCAEGKLIKKKVGSKLYLYYVDDIDIDSVLWNLVNANIEIQIHNISK